MVPEIMFRGRMFYGWWVVTGAAVISFWGGVSFYGITAFINPIVEHFHWSYLEVSIAGSMRSVELGLIAPIIGLLADRFGPRRVALLGGIVSGFGYILLGLTSSLPFFYFAFIVYSAGLTGMGHTVTMTSVANWFRKKVGRAMGFSMAGYGIGGISLPIIVWVIGTYDWRIAMFAMGIATWAIIIPASRMLRHRPEELGLQPDGETLFPPPEKAASVARADEPAAVTVKQVIKTRVFWILGTVFMVHMGITSAITLHAMPFFISTGLTPETGAVLSMMVPVSSILGRLLFGWLGDIYGHRRVLFIAILMQSAALVFLAFGTQVWHFAIFLLLYGPAFGGTFVLRPAIQRAFFGRGAFGSIQGAMLAVTQVGGLAAPVLAGWVYDLNNSYLVIWASFAAVMFLSGPLLLVMGKPKLTQSGATGA